MADNDDSRAVAQAEEESNQIGAIVPNEEFELVDAHRNVAEREDVAPDGGEWRVSALRDASSLANSVKDMAGFARLAFC